jgi:hypothetical protein
MNPVAPVPSSPWQRLSAGALRLFHAYGGWLVGISWKRFMVLSLLLLITANILQNLPPFSWTFNELVTVDAPGAPPAPKPPRPPREPVIKIEKPAPQASGAKSMDIQISIDEKGIRIRPGATGSEVASSPASGAASAPGGIRIGPEGIDIRVPPGADSEAVRQAVREARDAIKEAIEGARQAARDAHDAADEAAAEARDATSVTVNVLPGQRPSVVHFGDFLPELALLWITASAILKITYKGRLQAEVKAAQATETAESESLKRQVVEARMAAMQAQVEPHFLFNTLASIDHLIETDPKRASLMQKNLIALLRASMPTMREANASGVHSLGRELAVITPYLEILKVRMDERLHTEIRVSDGLMSADFPPMMLQGLVENAIKHGLEPKAEGGKLTVAAEIVHGKLAVSVADTGLGFGKAATAGTGIGLNNIRERLSLLYGARASLAVGENPGGGTVVTITVPYQARAAEADGV